MPGLLDLYGDALSQEQQQALRQRGLLGFLGGLQRSGALDYTVPFISGKMPGSFAAGLAGGAAGMGEAQDAGALNAMRAQQLGLNAQQTRANLALLQQEGDIASKLFTGQGGAPATAGPSTAAPGGATSSPAGVSPNIDSVTAGDTPEWRAFAQAVAGPESSGKFNVRYSPRGPVPFDDFSTHPNIAEKGPSGPSTAAGAWQITNSTFNGLGDERPADFSPPSQYAAFKAVARRDYSTITGRDLAADLKAGKTDLIARALRGTWPTIGEAMQAYPSLLANYSQAGTKVADNAPGLNTSLAGAGDNTGAGFGGAPTATGNGLATMLRPPAATAGGSLPPRPPGSAITYDRNGTPIDLDTGRPVGAPAAPAGGTSAAQPTPVVSPPAPGMLGGAPSSAGLSGVMNPPAPIAPAGLSGMMAPGGINPRAAQALSLLQSMRGANTPAFLNEAATMPFVGPKAAATAEEENAAKLRYAGPIAAAEAPYKVVPGRPGTLMWNGLGQPVGANPLMVESFGPEGNKTPAFITPPLPGSSAGVPGSPSVSGGYRDSSGNVVTGLGPGVVRGLETRATKEEDQRQKIIDDANAALRDQATIKTMASESDNFVRGPFANHVQSAARYLRLIDPSWNGQVAGYEDFAKNAGALTRQAVRETSARAAVQEFTMIANTLPAPEGSPIGMRRVQNELLGLSDFRIAKGQAQRQWEATHNGGVSGFETAFATQASPYSFVVARMDPQDRRELIAKLQGSDEGRRELARLGQQMQVMKSAGLGQY